LTAQGRQFVLTDTAGIRRKTTIAQRVEQFAVLAALKSIERSEVAALVLDATEPAVDQDARIARIAEEKGRGLLLVVNKWDLLSGAANQEVFREELKHRLKFVSYAPILFTSALQGRKVKKVLELGGMLGDQLRFRVSTGPLNRLLRELMDAHPPPFANGKPLRFYYIAQVGVEPPTFVLTSNAPGSVPDRYKRYLVNRLRAAFDLRVPIRLLFRERPGAKQRASRMRRGERTD
jgi:GTP-binding protein